MNQVNWDKAATDFKPSGKPIKNDSFKTSIGRLQSNIQGNGGAKVSGRKRKAADTDSPAAPSSRKSRGKKAKTEQDAEQDDAVDSASPEAASDRQTGSKEADAAQSTEQEVAAASDAAGTGADVAADESPAVTTGPEELFPKVKAEPEPTNADLEDEEYYPVF